MSDIVKAKEGVYTLRESEMSFCGCRRCPWWMFGSDVPTISGVEKEKRLRLFFFFFFSSMFSHPRSVVPTLFWTPTQ
ncbi:hypothetical protein BDV32DRAFT_24983 [Aspergillus pseudonomiae]|uniref:Uncharacterized protein n=1 Tax=Aspergillus pseudonomiae TaxID=1506151 RepID=A0A5N7CSX8_9EURO|nr:uncharacterized protein BDV37DRAFT_61342 [Aspergillus pseudonomiae]KAB8253939.1 hypothetical protein BDV32DRAFT_24983 [Aspergillus pseudonomiae]KAE8397255.1 hypothetical protein BDV37DRAFT_61342 [Aspergillus pseudonomiae]